MGNIIGPAEHKSFQELLADEARNQSPSLVVSILQAFKDGEPSAMKMVTQTLLDAQYSEQEKFPIDDDRFKQIIQLAAEAITSGEL